MPRQSYCAEQLSARSAMRLCIAKQAHTHTLRVQSNNHMYYVVCVHALVPSIIRLHEAESGSLSRFADALCVCVCVSLCACTWLHVCGNRLSWYGLSICEYMWNSCGLRKTILHNFAEEVVLSVQSYVLMWSFQMFGLQNYWLKMSSLDMCMFVL